MSTPRSAIEALRSTRIPKMMLGAMKHIKIVNSVIEHSVKTKISNADENVKTATENVNTADNTPENVLYLSRISVSILSKVRSPTSGRGSGGIHGPSSNPSRIMYVSLSLNHNPSNPIP